MKIRAKKGYNIIINDLKIALSTNGKIIEVDEQQFNESADAKQLKNFIEIVNDNEENTIFTNEIQSKIQVNKVTDQAFVIGTNNNKSIENAVLMDPNNVIKQPIKKAIKIDNNIIIEKQSIENNNINQTSNAQVVNINNMKTIDTSDNSKQLTKKAKKNELIKNEVKNDIKKEVRNEINDNKKVDINIDKKDEK